MVSIIRVQQKGNAVVHLRQNDLSVSNDRISVPAAAATKTSRDSQDTMRVLMYALPNMGA